MWDWEKGKKLVSFPTGHHSNVFQSKFLPLTGDTHLVSTSRDGQVRLAVLSTTGVCRSTKRLAQHKGPANKLALLPQVILFRLKIIYLVVCNVVSDFWDWVDIWA